ncbi:hypothetical protein JIQ42_06158 [Leishmania sp. Namibia]|uniref:hypothetical protein n=1 Tax=Leishmania sp. Namibia TaxID=2802991 RepID=UPI001B6F6AD8|nr:hypothetical protein JIQ42_06158 [Leishmania sp. Namibia]
MDVGPAVCKRSIQQLSFSISPPTVLSRLFLTSAPPPPTHTTITPKPAIIPTACCQTRRRSGGAKVSRFLPVPTPAARRTPEHTSVWRSWRLSRQDSTSLERHHMCTNSTGRRLLRC